MVFSSLSFLYAFLPVTAILYFVIKNRRYRNGILLLASLVFYAWGEPKYIVLLLLSTLLAYVGGLLISAFGTQNRRMARRAIFALTAALIVGILFVFKYFNLFAETANSLFSLNLDLKTIALPIGISFYTFQVLSYVIDLYWGKIQLQKNYFTLLLYVSFFPQLIAGPIVRYKTVENELLHRKETLSEFTQGVERFIFGLAKKVLLANNLAVISDTIFALSSNAAGTAAAWLAMLAYTLQIYFDFSGYSDMAIGLGQMFGFHFPQNFNYPYTAVSVTDFWRRWHISLSSWFRDYIYIPLGGNRVNRARNIFNILVVWCLTGFWHGAQWSFLLWGFYYAVLLIVEKLFLGRALEKLPAFFRWLYTMLVVVVGWTIFSHESVAGILSTLKTMFVWTSGSLVDVFAQNAQMIPSLFVLPIAALLAFPIARKLRESKSLPVAVLKSAVCFALLAASIASLLSSAYNPFIYFRF